MSYFIFLFYSFTLPFVTVLYFIQTLIGSAQFQSIIRLEISSTCKTYKGGKKNTCYVILFVKVQDGTAYYETLPP